MKIIHAVIVGICLTAAAMAHAEVQGNSVEYSAAGTTLKGYLAQNSAMTGKRPGVLVVHEWWGHNEYARKRADLLAQQGYVALAVDMYGDGKTADHPKEAGAFMAQVNNDKGLAQARFDAAKAFLRSQPNVDGEKLAAIGYCFGGGVVLNMARAGTDVRGVASFHGSLASAEPAAKGQIKTQVMVFTGADDRMVPPEQVAAFKQEMDAAGAVYEVISYPGVQHSFTNPQADDFAKKFDLPLAYDAAADKDSWAKLSAFLHKIFN